MTEKHSLSQISRNLNLNGRSLGAVLLSVSAVCSSFMTSSAHALSSADAQVLNVFGVLPWVEWTPGVGTGAPLQVWASFTCLLSSGPTDIYSASQSCAIETLGLTGGPFFRSDLGLDSTGSAPPSGAVWRILGAYDYAPRCSPIFFIPSGGSSYPVIHCDVFEVQPPPPSITLASPKNLGDDCIPCKQGIPGWAVGNPINAATGNKFQVETDFVGAASTELALRRTYNSQDTSSTAFGSNWHSTWHRSISLSNSTTATVTSVDGRIDTFTKNSSGVWASDPDVTSSLSALMSGTTQTGWQLVTADDSTEIYLADGRLNSVTDRAGNVTALGYDTNKRLTKVTGPFGHTLTFTYNTNNLVASVTLPDGGVLGYGYDANSNLSSVTYPDKTVHQYVYNEQANTANTNLPHALTGIIDEDGNRYATYQYDTSGRAVSSQHAGGADLTTIAYNADGSTSVNDALSNVHSYTLTTQFGLVKPTGVTGIPVTNTGGKAFTYDTNGFVSSRTDWNGNVTTYTHNSRGLETSRTEASGTALARTINTAWHPTFHLPTQITEPSGVTGVNRVSTFSYDAAGNLLNKTITAGSQTRSWTYTYNAAGQVLTAHDPLGNLTTTTYDGKGDVATVTDALGHVTQITSFDADGRPLTIKDPNSLVTTLGYDARGRIVSRVVGSETTTYAYDAAGNLTLLTKPDGSKLAYTYDAAHRLIAITDALGNKIAYTLDGNDNRTGVNVYDPTNTLTRTLAQQFDAVNRLAKSIGSQGQTTAFAYDSNGNTTNVTDPLNNQTTLAYDTLNRLSSSIDPNGNTTQTNYDSADNLLAVADPLNHVTNYSYDGLGNRLTTISPDTKQSQNSYDAAGNLISSVDALGQTVGYTYDALNRRTQSIYANKPAIVFSYDQGVNGIGHLTQMSDGTDTTQWAYDLHGRVTSKTFFSGTLTLVTQYSYATNGQLAAITYPSGKVVKLSYNSNGQIVELDNNTTPLLSAIQYQPFGLAKSWTFGNGIKTSRGFDLDGRITGYDLGGNRSRQLAYDAASRITGYNDTNLNYDQNFTYDNLARLTQYSDPKTQISYSYDANGNRFQQMTTGSPSQNYTLDANSNRLLGITSNNQPVKTYSYDAAGHITSDGYNTFTYDGRGRLVKASNVAIGSEQYRINGLGQRDAKVTSNPPDMSGDANQDGTINATDLRLIVLMASGSIPVNMAADCNHDGKITTADATCAQAKLADMHLNPGKYVQTGTYFMYDGAGYLLGEYTQSGTAIQETVWLGNTPVAVMSGNNSYYVYADHLNAPRAIADNTGTVVWRWDSEAFGTTLANSDPDGNGVVFTYNLRFPGQYFDKSTGLHYNWNRDYNPAIGRYIESDPIGLVGGPNTYSYVDGNPLSSIDPTGFYYRDLSPPDSSGYWNNPNTNPNEFGLGMHGSPGGRLSHYGRSDSIFDDYILEYIKYDDNSRSISGLADIILNDPNYQYYKDRDIRLYICHSGESTNGTNSTAQQLASELSKHGFTGTVWGAVGAVSLDHNNNPILLTNDNTIDPNRTWWLPYDGRGVKN